MMDSEQPSTSHSSMQCDFDESVITEETKQELGNAVHVFIKLLEEKGIVSPTASTSVSIRSRQIGKEIFDRFWDMYGEMTFVEVEEIIHENETDVFADFVEVSGSEEDETDSATSSSLSPRKLEPELEKQKPVSLDVKINAVVLAKQHPKWSLKSLQTKGATILLKRKDMLRRWEKDIGRGGTNQDKYAFIDKWTFDRFVEARERAEHVTTITLQRWAMGAAMQYISNDEDFKFTASLSWVKNFKNKHRIRQRHVTKYISKKEITTFQDVLETAHAFQTQARALITQYDPDYVINTDQTGCEYRVGIKRTLSHKGEKRTFVSVGSVNKVTHSYTAQYSITASGKLLPTVFICLQELNGKFGPKVSEEIEVLKKKMKNVYVTCSKSGKLTSAIYQLYLDHILKPYVKKNKFCLLLDSWGGQTDMTRYDLSFVDDQGQPTCTVKVIPPKCTPLCQPCDVYFFRQVKNFIARIQNNSESLRKNKELHNRADALKIHSLIHNQLSAPKFKDMLLYAWHASKLIYDRRVFNNVNQVCFPQLILQKKCTCGEISFICCAWCQMVLCFTCFYDKFHPSVCERLGDEDDE